MRATARSSPKTDFCWTRHEVVPNTSGSTMAPEFTSAWFVDWCRERQITIEYTRPGKPTDNGFVERFNGTFRREVIDAWQFNSLEGPRGLPNLKAAGDRVLGDDMFYIVDDGVFLA